MYIQTPKADLARRRIGAWYNEMGAHFDQNRGMRIGDAERDSITEELAEQCALGRLTPDEFESRMGRALRAKYEGQLVRLTQDLPELPPHPDPPYHDISLNLKLKFIGATMATVALIFSGITMGSHLAAEYSSSQSYQNNTIPNWEEYRERLIQEEEIGVSRFSIDNPKAVVCYGGRMTMIPGNANSLGVRQLLASIQGANSWMVTTRSQAHKIAGKTC